LEVPKAETTISFLCVSQFFPARSTWHKQLSGDKHSPAPLHTFSSSALTPLHDIEPLVKHHCESKFDSPQVQDPKTEGCITLQYEKFQQTQYLRIESTYLTSIPI
jgi:hypothetical protein